jgi:hypothetical protein
VGSTWAVPTRGTPCWKNINVAFKVMDFGAKCLTVNSPAYLFKPMLVILGKLLPLSVPQFSHL